MKESKVDPKLPGLTAGMIETTLTAEVIQKYRKRSTANLKLEAIRVFNAWIRKRDELCGCITCGSFNEIQAGHYHAAGQNNHLRFNEFNVNSQCKRCNYYLRGAQAKYRMNLVQKIGEEKVKRLDEMAADRGVHKTDRFFLIETIEKYKHLKKLRHEKRFSIRTSQCSYRQS